MDLLPKRPGLGTEGRKTRVRTNFLEVKSLPRKIIHYDVTISPTVPPRLNRRVFERLVQLYRGDGLGQTNPVYDGRSNMFSNQKLPLRNDAASFDVILQEDNTTVTSKRPPRKFVVELKKVKEINLEELEKFIRAEDKRTDECTTAITALDILISYKVSLNNPTFRNSFFTSRETTPISGGLEVWRGYYQSARPTRGKMLINIDLSATAFYVGGPLVKLVTSILEKKSPDDLRNIPTKNFNKVERIIKGLQIKDNHRPGQKRRFKITGLTKTPASLTFFNKDGIESSVKDYFEKEYRPLNFPHLPCVIIKKDVFLPMEVCDVIEGQRYQRKLGDRQTSEMMNFTRQNPSVRVNKINQGIEILNYNGNENLQQFGIRISNEMVTVNARVLPTPVVQYHPSSREARITPRDGAWNLKDKKVAAGTTLSSWTVLSFKSKRDLPEQVVSGFIRTLVGVCQDTGMNIPNRDPPIMYGSIQNVEEELKKAWVAAGNKAKSQPQLILCILPYDGKELYGEIKRVSDTVIGVASQCIQSKFTRNPQKQYCANVCLKINVKLGGMNSFINPTNIKFIADRPTILMGADVTHPGRDSNLPSIAALCASMDAKASRYAAFISLQTSRQEMIAGLENMVKEAFKTFYQTCARKPERILFYRDGVSEGQFKEVLEAEVKAIKAACKSLEENYNPTITFIVVQKRHHTRFFPLDKRDSDRSGNCLPGMVVETEITHPFEFDFYLQSHSGILGTSRPAHYHVLLDQNGFNSNTLQTLSYNLCYSYARCTRSVSLVPPVYYAHVVCARARLHIKGGYWSDTESSEASSVTPPTFGEVKKELQPYMYYM